MGSPPQPDQHSPSTSYYASASGTGPDLTVDEGTLRQQLSHYAQKTYGQGFVAATDGNLSARLPRRGRSEYLISPSGVSLGELDPESFVRVDRHGEPLPPYPRLRPSSEFRMHLAVYENRPDVQAIVHAHPPITLGFSIAGRSLAGCVLPEVVVGLGAIQTIEYTTPTTQETADLVGRMIVERDALILDRHGTVTVGHDVRDAYLKLEKVEHTAHISFVAQSLGRIRTLPEDEVARLLEMRKASGLPPIDAQELLQRPIPNCNNCGLGCQSSCS